MIRLLHLLLFVGALAVAGCGEADAPAETSTSARPSMPDAPALTWAEWVDLQAPIRDAVPEADRQDYRRPGGRPNMTRWRPEDFLPREAISAPHVDICELPLAERREVGKLWRWFSGDSGSLTEEEVRAVALKYSRLGVAQAQATMGHFHSPGREAADDPSPRTRRILHWLEHAAASGLPYAMYSLGGYQFRMLTAAGPRVRDAVPLVDFRWDEVNYWFWRAATGFHEFGLLAMEGRLKNHEWQNVETYYRENVLQYKWTRLSDLVQILTPGFVEGRGLLGDADSVVERKSALTPERVALAEREVGEFLRTHREALARYRRPFGCPDMTWLDPDAPTFDWAALNREIAQYGVQVQPRGDRWSVREDWPPGE